MILCDRCGNAGAARVSIRPVIAHTADARSLASGVDIDLCGRCRDLVLSDVFTSLVNMQTRCTVHLNQQRKEQQRPCTSTPPACS